MKRENFYRRDPGAALAGMAGMSLEERGVYNTVIDLLYLTWRPVEDNRAYIAGHCGCAVQKLNPLIGRLLASGKLVRFEDGGQAYISNPKFETERDSVKGVTTRSGRGEVGEKSEGVGEKSASVEKNPPTCPEKCEEKPPVTHLEKSRVDESRLSDANASSPRPVRSADFDAFWTTYPNKVAKRKAQEAYARAIRRITGPDPPSVILAGVERAKAGRKWLGGYIEHPATWLNGDCWEDQPAEVIPLQTGQPHGRQQQPPSDAKLDARHANYARSWAGSELAARQHREP